MISGFLQAMVEAAGVETSAQKLFFQYIQIVRLNNIVSGDCMGTASIFFSPPNRIITGSA
jgi:hypothetical protein